MKKYIQPTTEVNSYESAAILYMVSSNAGITTGGHGNYDPR